MNVEHAVETGRENRFQLEQADLSLERADTVDRSARRTEHEAWIDVFFLRTLDTEPNLLTTSGVGNFVFRLSVEGADDDLGS